MDVLSRIVELREERHWTEYQLAEKSGLTQSTISSWYRKSLLPTIPSLRKICDAFGISLSQFFMEEQEKTFTLSDRQLELLEGIDKLTSKQQDSLLTFLKTL